MSSKKLLVTWLGLSDVCFGAVGLCDTRPSRKVWGVLFALFAIGLAS